MEKQTPGETARKGEKGTRGRETEAGFETPPDNSAAADHWTAQPGIVEWLRSGFSLNHFPVPSLFMIQQEVNSSQAP